MTLASPRSQNPGDLPHLPECLSGLVYESRALSDRELYATVRICRLAHHDFLARPISPDDESVSAGLAQRWPVEGSAVLDLNIHQLHPFQAALYATLRVARPLHGRAIQIIRRGTSARGYLKVVSHRYLALREYVPVPTSSFPWQDFPSCSTPAGGNPRLRHRRKL
jgi:hypothetical protein